MISDVIKDLCQNIIHVYSLNNKNVYYNGDFIPIEYKHKYSSSLNNSIRLKNNDDIIPIKDMIVNYRCPTCKNESEILLKRFLGKLTSKCPKCKENDIIKRNRQSNFIKTSFSEFGKVKPKESDIVLKFKDIGVIDLIKKSDTEFELESDVFKTNYFINNPTTDEFNKIKNKIKIDGIDILKSTYYPHVKTTHSHKYSPKILDEFNKLHLLNNVKYKCDSCNSEFTGRNLKEKSNQYKVLCKDCYLCNRTFKVRYINNIKGIGIRYQSKPELDLINYCNINSILISNGPTIQYIFKGKSHKYIIDFKVKDILIEVKEDHIWHRNELESGKWEAKEKAAIDYCKLNKMEYRLVMKSDITKLKNFIARYNYI